MVRTHAVEQAGQSVSISTDGVATVVFDDDLT